MERMQGLGGSQALTESSHLPLALSILQTELWKETPCTLGVPQ
jgi:hypothetical protein